MNTFTTFASAAALLLGDDIDTDQIIPARFLTTTERVGLGTHLFADWRFESGGAEILVAGRNFGCGSSREHAAWALVDHGFRAVVATSFGDIFQTNALKNGLLPAVIADDEHRALVEALTREPASQITVDLVAQVVELPGIARYAFPIDPFAKHCLIEGIDELEFLIESECDIGAYERSHPAFVRTAR